MTHNVSIVYKEYKANPSIVAELEETGAIRRKDENRELFHQKAITIRFSCSDDVSGQEVSHTFNEHMKANFEAASQAHRDGYRQEGIVNIISLATRAAQLTCSELGGMFVPIVADKIINIELMHVMQDSDFGDD